jgi:hypothetical protein
VVLSDVEEDNAVSTACPVLSSVPLPVLSGELAVCVSIEAAACVATCVAGSMVVWVNRLNRLLLSVPPTPTAGTAPSSVPLPVGVTEAFGVEAVSVAAAAFAGSVGACLLHGDLGVNERPLTT